MPHVKTTQAFYFDELSESAKERARQWAREGAAELFEPDSVYDDAATIADLIGINLRTRPVKLMSGATRYEPAIYYSGFWSQGDGACFEGEYSYKKGALAAIKAHAPGDIELRGIAERLAAIQARNFYRLSATVKHVGRYSHEYSTEIDVSRGDGTAPEDTADLVREALRDFMRWIYRAIESEYEYQTSNETIDAGLRDLETEFDESGNVI